VPETNENTVVFRLLFRPENKMWNAYLARSSTVENALLIGSICMSSVIFNEDRKQAFIKMMSAVVSEMLEDVLGEDAKLVTMAPPERDYEASGHG
jgi:hypothetical protein